MQASCKGKQSAKHDTLIESSLRSVTPMKIRMASYLSLACFAVLLLGLDDGIGHRGRAKLLHHLATNQPLACSEGTIPFLLLQLEVKRRLLPAAFAHFPLFLKDLQHRWITKSSWTSSTNFDWCLFASESEIIFFSKISKLDPQCNAMNGSLFFSESFRCRINIADFRRSKYINCQLLQSTPTNHQRALMISKLSILHDYCKVPASRPIDSICFAK